MISLTNMDPINSAASARDALLEIGITQESQSAQTAAARKAGAAKMEVQLDGTPLGKNPRLSANPLNIGPVATPNYIQPNTAAPAPSAATVQTENHRNPLNVVGPQVPYVQPNNPAPPPVAGQLSSQPSCLGASKITHADGTVTST